MKEYWVEEGGSVAVFQPPELPGLILGRRLSGFLVNGVHVEPGPGGLLLLTDVREPMQVVAIYETVILWSNVAIFAGIVFSVVLIYMAYDFIMSRREMKALESAHERLGTGESRGEKKEEDATP